MARHRDFGGLSRRSFLAGASLAAAAAIGSRSSAQTEFRFGLTPVFLSDDLDLLAKLQAYMERAIERPIRLITKRTYQEITALLVSGQLEAAWICGYPFVQFRSELALVAVPVWHRQPLYQAYLITSPDRRASGIDDLAGDIHAFSDPDSNSGHLVTRALLARRRTRPDAFFRRTFFTYGHRNVIRAVGARLAQSGSVDGYVWEVMREVEPALTGATRIVARSEWLGFPPIACPNAIRQRADVRRLAESLVTMAADPLGRRILGMLRLDGFQEAEASLFDRIAQNVALVQELG